MEKKYNVQQFIKLLLMEGINLSSFKPKDKLNPFLFDEDKKMHFEIKEKLLLLAKDFWESLEMEWVDYSDVWLTGSMANYNWSHFSDIDLHLLTDYSKISKRKEIADNLFWALKDNWNNKHDINIYNFDVEMYVQDENDEVVSSGIYSVMQDKWIKMPEKKTVKLNSEEIENFVLKFEERYDKILEDYRAKRFDDIDENIEDFFNDVYEMRQRSLEDDGEFGSGNIAFKYLRRLDVLGKLKKIKNEVYDAKYGTFDKNKLQQLNTAKKKIAYSDIEGGTDSTTSKSKSKKGSRYEINGKKFSSLRQAAAKTGIPKSTIEYRIKSDDPQYKNFKRLK